MALTLDLKNNPGQSIVPSKDFHISDVLTITTGRLVSLRHIEGVYDILNFMTGNSLFTHELPAASDRCKPALLAQHPRLGEITEEFMDSCKITKENLNAWVSTMVETFGETLPVSSIAHTLSPLPDPITTLEQVVSKEKVIAILKG